MAVKKQKQSTLEGICSNTILAGRKVGNSTRLVDIAIQILFSGKICVVKDHFQNGENVRVNLFLCAKVLDRLFIEHSLQKHNVLYNREKLEIELVGV